MKYRFVNKIISRILNYLFLIHNIWLLYLFCFAVFEFSTNHLNMNKVYYTVSSYPGYLYTLIYNKTWRHNLPSTCEFSLISAQCWVVKPRNAKTNLWKILKKLWYIEIFVKISTNFSNAFRENHFPKFHLSIYCILNT